MPESAQSQVGQFTLAACGTHEQIIASVEYAMDRFQRGSNFEPLLDMTNAERPEIGKWRFTEGACCLNTPEGRQHHTSCPHGLDF